MNEYVYSLQTVKIVGGFKMELYKCERINSLFIADTSARFNRYFDFPAEAEAFRLKWGFVARPKEFELTEENYDRLINVKHTPWDSVKDSAWKAAKGAHQKI